MKSFLAAGSECTEEVTGGLSLSFPFSSKVTQETNPSELSGNETSIGTVDPSATGKETSLAVGGCQPPPSGRQYSQQQNTRSGRFSGRRPSSSQRRQSSQGLVVSPQEDYDEAVESNKDVEDTCGAGVGE